MIYCNLNDLEALKENKFIYDLVSTLLLEDKLNFNQARSFVLPNGVAVNYISLTSKDELDCKFEAHRNFADVHIVVNGAERIKVADVKGLEELVAYDKEKDIAFYSGSETATFDLFSSDLLFCDLEDAHKVAIKVDEIAAIDKIVLKVPKTLYR